MSDTKVVITPDALLRIPDDGNKYELVDGELRVSAAGVRHEEIGALIISLLMAFVRPRRLGIVCGSSAGYKLPNGRVRSPDVSFIAMERLPGGRAPEGFGDFMPDLAVEILSPGDSIKEVEEKFEDYFTSGARLVWLVDPAQETVTVYRSTVDRQVLRRDDPLTGEPVLPGFTCPVQEFFE